MSSTYTDSLNELISQLSNLPGIGPKTAERLSFYILKSSPEKAMALANAISDVKTKIKHCQNCYNLCEDEICNICADSRRNKEIICVVEQPKDIISLEKTGSCKWLYHVLGGHIAPLEGTEAKDLTIDSLIERIDSQDIKELVMATNPNMTGDGTAFYISSLLRDKDIKITRLARGLPSGSTIEYANGRILTDAIVGRQNLS